MGEGSVRRGRGNRRLRRHLAHGGQHLVILIDEEGAGKTCAKVRPLPRDVKP